jgi:CheY-like chemotaxis protein
MTAQVTENRNIAAQPLLMVTPLEGVENTAAALAEKLGLAVDVASTRAAALRLLNRRSYAAVIVDQMLAEADPEGAELIWKGAGLAIPIPISFALTGPERVEREVRSALARRRRETQLATTAAAAALDSEIKNAVTGMLLESQRALVEQDVPPRLADRLQRLAGIADQLREKLTGAPAQATTVAALRRAGG